MTKEERDNAEAQKVMVMLMLMLMLMLMVMMMMIMTMTMTAMERLTHVHRSLRSCRTSSYRCQALTLG